MTEVKRFSIVKPTLQTPFQIDFNWWKQHDNNWRLFLFSCLCPEHQKTFETLGDSDTPVDWVDPETAEIHQVDGMQQALMSHCAKQETFLSERTALVDAAFRVLIANGNQPMTPVELAAALNRQPEIILRTLSGPQVYRGIRPKQT